MSGPLAGLRVIELCDELGQYAGKLLADLGADVTKVEPPEGSTARGVGPFVRDIPGPNRSLNFWYHNTNKRSVVLDYANDESDRARLCALVDSADILIEDRPPGTLADLGLGYAALSQQEPDISAEVSANLKIIREAGESLMVLLNDVLGLTETEIDAHMANGVLM